MAHPFPNCRQRFFDASGDPLNGGKVYTYYGGTNTPFPTYTDSTEDAENTNPIILDSEGYCDMWLAGGVYKVVLKTSADVTIWTRDNITIPGLGPAGEYERNNFTGDGSDVTFELDFEVGNINYIQVYIDGVYQHKSTYSMDGLTTLTFSEAPPNNSAIEVMIGRTIDIAVYAAAEAAATALAAAAAASAAAALVSENNAETAETNAETAETNAEAAQALAEAARDAAITARNAAQLAETNAETAETNAETAEANAETAQAAAEAAQLAAEIAAASATMTGPVSSTDNALTRWNGISGQAVQNSTVTLGDTGAMVNETTADVVNFTAKASVGQTAKLYSGKSSGDTELFSVSPAGDVIGSSFKNLNNTGFTNSVFSTAYNGGIAFGNATDAAFEFTTTYILQAYQAMVKTVSNLATNIGIIIKAHASQSANLLETHDSANAVLSGLDKIGIHFVAEQGSTPAAPSAGYQKIYPKSDGNWYKRTSAGESPLGGGAFSVTGTRASPSAIVAGTGIAFTGADARQLWFIEGSGGAVDVSANPQIAAATTVGQELTLVGRSDTNTVTLENGTGLDLNGECVLGASSVLSLVWDGSAWVEMSRR